MMEEAEVGEERETGGHCAAGCKGGGGERARDVGAPEAFTFTFTALGTVQGIRVHMLSVLVL